MSPQTVQLHTLGTHGLKRPLSCIVELDGTEWLAQAPDLDQVFGVGPTVAEAVASLKREIASLYEDLEEDDRFAPEWLPVHRFLRELISDL